MRRILKKERKKEKKKQQSSDQQRMDEGPAWNSDRSRVLTGFHDKSAAPDPPRAVVQTVEGAMEHSIPISYS